MANLIRCKRVVNQKQQHKQKEITREHRSKTCAQIFQSATRCQPKFCSSWISFCLVAMYVNSSLDMSHTCHPYQPPHKHTHTCTHAYMTFGSNWNTAFNFLLACCQSNFAISSKMPAGDQLTSLGMKFCALPLTIFDCSLWLPATNQTCTIAWHWFGWKHIKGPN